MAEAVEGFPARRYRISGSGVFEQCLDGRVWKFRLGEEVHVSAHIARTNAYNFASKRGMRAITSAEDSYLYVQFVTK